MSEVEYKKCPKCGANMLIEEGVMTASIPPMYRYHCPLCGEMDFDTKMYPMPEVMHEPIPVMINRLPIDWNAFRMEVVKDFMSAIITREAPQYNFACRNIADRVTEAIMWADELIKQLKEK